MDRAGPVLGLVLQVAAVTAAAALVGGVVVGWRTLGALDDTTDDGVQVALAGLDAVESSLETADELLVDSRLVLDMAIVALESVVGSVDETSDALASVADLAQTTAPALESVRETLQSLSGTARTIDTTLSALARLPIGPDYDPDRAFGPAVEQLVDNLAPVPDALRATSAEVGDLASVTEGFDDELVAVTDALAGIRTMLADSGSVLDEYRDAARSARLLAAEAGTGAGTDRVLGRVVLVLAGLSLAVGQVVPFRHGTALRTTRAGRG